MLVLLTVGCAPLGPWGRLDPGLPWFRWLDGDEARYEGNVQDLGEYRIWLGGDVDPAEAPLDCPTSTIPPLFEDRGRWRLVDRTPDGVPHRIELTIEDESLSGSTWVEPLRQRGRGPWRLTAHVDLDVEAFSGGEALSVARDGWNVLVDWDGTEPVELRFSGSLQSIGSIVVGDDIALMPFALPGAEYPGELELVVAGLPPGRTWIGTEVTTDREGRLVARWQNGHRAALVSPSDPTSLHSRGDLELYAPPHGMLDVGAILERAEQTRAISRQLGLSEPPRQIVRTPTSFSYAGPPILLANYALHERRWGHVIGHEIGHTWYAASEVSEAGAAWVASWVDDPDGTPTTAWYKAELTHERRCPLVAPHSFEYEIDMHGGALVLVMIEDRIGRERLAPMLQEASGWWDLRDRLGRHRREEGNRIEPWLRTERWPAFLASIVEGRLVFEEQTDTGLSADVQLALVRGDERELVTVPFGPDAEPLALPGDIDRVEIDPRHRLPASFEPTTLEP